MQIESSPAPGVTEKRCRHCGETKPPSEFRPDWKMRDGLDSWCRNCHTEATKRSRRRRRLGLTPTPWPQPKPRYAPIEERWTKYVKVSDGCWEWQGMMTPNGYGKISRDSKYVGAHRVAYELHAGPIPDGTEIDHLCSNPGCVRPAHLDTVTHEENVRRDVVRQRLHALGLIEITEWTIPVREGYRPGRTRLPCAAFRGR